MLYAVAYYRQSDEGVCSLAAEEHEAGGEEVCFYPLTAVDRRISASADRGLTPNSDPKLTLRRAEYCGGPRVSDAGLRTAPVDALHTTKSPRPARRT